MYLPINQANDSIPLFMECEPEISGSKEKAKKRIENKTKQKKQHKITRRYSCWNKTGGTHTGAGRLMYGCGRSGYRLSLHLHHTRYIQINCVRCAFAWNAPRPHFHARKINPRRRAFFGFLFLLFFRSLANAAIGERAPIDWSQWAHYWNASGAIRVASFKRRRHEYKSARVLGELYLASRRYT